MNTIRIKRSAVSASPVTLQDGELAYSSSSGNLFIGAAGNTIEVVGGSAHVLKLNGIEPGATGDLLPSEILALLKTVDGAGSGLDAELLNGVGVGALVSKSTLGGPNGVATLDANGVIPAAQIPALAITTPFVVNSELAQLALVAQPGDVAIRTDLNGSFMLTGTSGPGVLANWLKISSDSVVTSVSGKVGAVILTATDVGADPVGASAAVQLNLDAVRTELSAVVNSLLHYLQDTDVIDGGTF